MKYETKILKGPKLSNIYQEMIQDNWELDYYDKEESISLWKRKLTKKVKAKNIEDTWFYPENLELYKKWSPKLREAYKTFRRERYAQHNDYVSYGAEKLLINKINKYNETISIKLMEASSGYKSIVEHEKIINEGRTAIQIEENRAKEFKVEQDKKEAMDKRRKQDEAIKKSEKPYKYWEELAINELREQYPNYSETMLRGQLNPRIRTILQREGFL